ncbi:MAG: alpha/beta fold hydrolase [Zymomonas mobilis subsp. pomaceae]|uniref:Alpha/beta hydrolase fold protein n=1 Tax=Zymomonas mobilis subsp. pomaceae (strain ATCC 29192 / DSM 22645 / JCM 10191 / CCUG 17912 / NBRC 13757 / NCIMB 11200 / NRRL B-4491 / Barker I) TaxID=579138 RepID=F8EWD8_ZYMMT|nr:alpha/beta fold hydrolase [Zymomonas mobilis]AEI38548.1 alpha/beta hydrolase fold protein [Zymomonas mobilis subsp. pomaceae ATCC 29192]MDX5948238.1 alpha/beta fold hydrolase [Zymomonas mobilis subsp. pomaceae]GEB88993.1 alpha/beta hydrolase [Zymomonas mobilis subsp. pomaceae]
MPDQVTTTSFTTQDGIQLAWYEIGKGYPIILLHGLFSSAFMNWIRPGHADLLAQAGFRVIMPDLRGHGKSDRAKSDKDWPKDILIRDNADFIAALELKSFALGGYSLGARIATHLCLKGLQPEKLILAGMGLEGLTTATQNLDLFQNAIVPDNKFPVGSIERFIQNFFYQSGCNNQAMLYLLSSQSSVEKRMLTSLLIKTLVITGNKDYFNGSAADLVQTLPQAEALLILGDHMSAVMQPTLAEGIIHFIKNS